MKKSITILALAFGVTSTFAQDLTSKKGEQILPEAEDWSIGIDANPFLEYMGNFFGKTTTNPAPSFNFLGSNRLITGKFFAEANSAYRASLRIGIGSLTQRNMVQDRFAAAVNAATPPPNTYPSAGPQKENVWKHSTTNIGLAVGMEKRKGKTRLQGFYGGELGINFSSSKDKFTYGNNLNPLTAASTTANPVVDVHSDDSFSGAANVTSSVNIPGIGGPARIIERKNGSVFSFGIRGFIGVEYFVLPKISIGGEFGWGIGLSSTGKSTTKYESIGNNGVSADDVVGSTTIEGAKDGSFTIDTDNNNSIFGPSASLRLNFHF